MEGRKNVIKSSILKRNPKTNQINQDNKANQDQYINVKKPPLMLDSNKIFSRPKILFNLEYQINDIEEFHSNKIINESESVPDEQQSFDSHDKKIKSDKLANFFYDLSIEAREERLSYIKLEELLMAEFTMIQSEYNMLSTEKKESKINDQEEVRLKMRIGIEFCESSYMQSQEKQGGGNEAGNLKNSIPNPNIFSLRNVISQSPIQNPNQSVDYKSLNEANSVFNSTKLNKHKDYLQTRLYYYGKMISILLKKYKPLIFTKEGVALRKQKSMQRRSLNYFHRASKDVNTVSINPQEAKLLLLKQNENYLKFSYDMREMDKKLMDSIAHIKFGKNRENQDNDQFNFENQNAITSNKSQDDLKEINLLNRENTLLKLILFKIFKLPYDNSHYVNWKSYLLCLISRWKYQEELKDIQPRKMKIKYLKTKFCIEKLILNKQAGKLRKWIEIDLFYGSNNKKLKSRVSSNPHISRPGNEIAEIPLIDYILHTYFGLLNKVLPIMTFAYDTNFMIFFDFLFDLQVLYFIFLCPIIVVIQVDINSIITPMTMFFHSIYCFDILRKFRRLKYTETNVIETNLGKLFRSIFFDINFLFSLSTLIPYISFFPNITPLQVSSLYSVLFLLPIFRMLDFGRSMEYLEKTKYAVLCRLVLLIIRFFGLAHWMGLLFVRFVDFDYLSSSYSLEDECKQLEQGKINLTDSCKYIIALMDGTYLIPGGFISGLDPKKTSDYIFIFFSFFIGQIIVAYVFGGVTSLIANLNQAAKLYREKLDTIKSFMLFYSFSEDITKDINIYYEYLWLKKRNLVYDRDLLVNLSESLVVKISHEVYPHQRFFLKDFYGISKNKEKKLISTLICNMKEYLAFPFERIYSQGEMIKGLFVLTDGTAIFTDRTKKDEQTNDENLNIQQDDFNTNNVNKIADPIRYDFNNKVTVDRKGFLERQEFNKVNGIKDEGIPKREQFASSDPNLTIMPLDSIFLKTGRGIETCYVDDFADFFLIELNFFDEKLIVNFPTEMQILKEIGVRQGLAKIGENNRIQKLVFKHSDRSIGSMYEEDYNLDNVWIEIAHKIPTFINQENIVGEGEDTQTMNFNSPGLFEISLNSFFTREKK